MAKIGSLEVTKIKITNDSLNHFYTQTSSGTSNVSLTVPLASNNPTVLFAFCWSNNCMVRRNRGNKYIGSGEGVPPNGYTAFVCFDDDPIDNDVYVMSGSISTSPENRLSALVQMK